MTDGLINIIYRIGRDIQEDCIINGVKFLQGFTIGISIYALHKDPEFWEDPEKFDPERFVEGFISKWNDKVLFGSHYKFMCCVNKIYKGSGFSICHSIKQN